LAALDASPDDIGVIDDEQLELRRQDWSVAGHRV
jgi:hypothetical protein